jgi:hypothetical protein
MKWEYKIIQIEDNDGLNNLVKLQNDLNKYGSDGWEVVEILRQAPKGVGWLANTEKNALVLKRACN